MEKGYEKQAKEGDSVYVEDKKVSDFDMRAAQINIETKQLIDCFSKAASIIDENEIILYCNSKFARILETDIDNLLGSNFLDFFDEENKEIIKNQTIVRKTGAPSIYELTITTPYDVQKRIRCQTQPCFSEGGHFKYTFGEIENITDEPLNSEKLQNYKSAMESSIDGIAILDKNHRYSYLNQAHVNIYGYKTKNELIGKTWRILYDKKELKRFETEIMPSLLKNGKWKGEAVGKKKNGEYFDQELSLSILEDGGLICVVRNISESKRRKNLLEESRTKFESLFKNAPISILIVDPKEGKILEFNETAHLTLDYSRKLFQEFSLNDIEPLKNQEEITARLKTIILSAEETYKTQFETRTGEKLDMSVTAKTVEFGGKKYIQLLCQNVTELKNKNFELIDSQSRYRALIENSGEAVFIVKDDKIVYYNDKTLEITGRKKSEIEAINPFELFSKKDQKLIKQTAEDALKLNKQPSLIQTSLSAKNGTKRFVEIAINPAPYEGGIGALLSVRDITERKRLEKAYKLLVDNSLQGLVIYKDSKIVFANKKARQLTGYSFEELYSFNTGKVLDLVHPDDREKTQKIMRARLLSDAPPKRYRHRITTKSGETKWLEVQADKITYYDSTALQAEYVDITQRKQIEEQLERNEKKYRTLVENAFDAIFLMKNEKIEYANPTFSKLTGYSIEELTAPEFEFKSILTDDSVKIFERILKNNKFKEKYPKQFRLKIKNKNGNVIDVELNSAILEKGKETRFISVMRDITERKKNEEEMKDLIVALHISKNLTEERAEEIEKLNKKLKESERNLKEINASKDKFFSILAHDLRGPFSGFVGLARTLAKNLDILSISEVQEISQDMLDSAQHISRLLENLLQWSRIQRNTVQVEPEIINIKHIAELNVDLFKQNARQKGVELVNDISGELNIWADVNATNTIFRNLISNAIKFTNKNDKIILSAKNIDKDKVEIIVADTGVGMDEKTASKLFRIDVHHTSEGTNKEKGTGLGLILCQELVEMNDGEISVESELNVGTTFRFTLPRKELQI